jgi:Concanavalin A-like lectin/glucanases superfamily
MKSMHPLPVIKSIGLNNKVLPLAVALAFCGIRAASAADYSTTILSDHPVAYYELQEPNGSASVADSSGNNVSGAVNYVTQSDNVTVYPQLGVPGIDSNAVLFATSTGAGQGNIDIPFSTTVNPTLGDGITGAPFSAELWVEATLQPSGYEVPLDNSCNFSQPPPWNNSCGWNFYQTPGPASTWSFSLRPNPGLVFGGPAVTLGQWTHLVLTYDGTNAILYANGVAAITYPNVPQYLANNGSSDMLMGEGPNTGQIPFDGNISQVAIYNYALSYTQVTNHYVVGTNEIRAIPTAPYFSQQPSSATNYEGVPVTFSSLAAGTAPLSYQWQRVGSGLIPNATNSSYTITPAFPGDNGATFYVTATNSVGSTNSDMVTLTVETNLNIVYNPFSITRRVGSWAAFRVVANGALPITYQWHSISNSIDQAIAGATSDTLWLSNVPASANGNLYYAQVTNPYGSSASGQASLSVVARSSFAPVTAYSKIVMAGNPVAYWHFDESSGATTALDAAGSFDGQYLYTPPDLTFGYPSGIPNNSIDTAIHVTNTAIVTIPYALELNPVTGPWTYEFWIQPTSVDPVNFHTPISSQANPNFTGLTLSGWNIYLHPASYWTWNIFNGGPNGSFTSEFVDHPIVPGEWYYMVLTDDGTNMNWFVNNRLVLTESVSGVGFVQNGINGDPSVAGGPTTIAIRSDNQFGDWDGGVEDLAIYNYVLSPLQIQEHFLNTTYLTAVKSGTNVVVTWPAGTLQSATSVGGPYSNVGGASSPYTNSASASSHLFYRVQLQ